MTVLCLPLTLASPTSILKGCNIFQPISRQLCMIQTIRGHSQHLSLWDCKCLFFWLDCWIIFIDTQIVDINSTNIPHKQELHGSYDWWNGAIAISNWNPITEFSSLDVNTSLAEYKDWSAVLNTDTGTLLMLISMPMRVTVSSHFTQI